MRSIRATIFAMLITLAPGCIVTGTARVRTTSPDMVMIDDGVYVIEDYDDSVFYSDNYYWRYHGGAWYRSSYHTGGWVVVNTVPGRVRGIHNPHGYVHYHGSGNVRRERVREHRQETRTHRKKSNNSKRPKVRDHR